MENCGVVEHQFGVEKERIGWEDAQSINNTMRARVCAEDNIAVCKSSSYCQESQAASLASQISPPAANVARPASSPSHLRDRDATTKSQFAKRRCNFPWPGDCRGSF